MRWLAVLVSVLLLLGLASGCREDAGKDVTRTIMQPIKKADRVTDEANLAALKQSIAAQHALNGTYPESLDETARAMGVDPEKYDYDPATGNVALKR